MPSTRGTVSCAVIDMHVRDSARQTPRSPRRNHRRSHAAAVVSSGTPCAPSVDQTVHGVLKSFPSLEQCGGHDSTSLHGLAFHSSPRLSVPKLNRFTDRLVMRKGGHVLRHVDGLASHLQPGRQASRPSGHGRADLFRRGLA